MKSMISKFNGRPDVVDGHPESRVLMAASELYRAECAWHDAHQTRVDAWMMAASAKLDAAIAAYLAAVAATLVLVSGRDR